MYNYSFYLLLLEALFLLRLAEIIIDCYDGGESSRISDVIMMLKFGNDRRRILRLWGIGPI